MASYDILCIGEVNVDLVLSGVETLPRFGEEVLANGVGMHVGGCTANVATFAARLGLKAALRARVGRDDFGDFLLAELEQAGVCTDHIIRDEDLRTGITVSISGPHDRAFVTYLGTIDSLSGDDVSEDLLRSAGHIHVGSYFMQRKLQPSLEALFQRARGLAVTSSLDTGYDPYENWDSGVRAAIAAVDYLMPNEVEVTRITGIADPRQAAEQLAECGTSVALKLGAEGSALYAGGETLHAPGLPVDVVDTTCCGDAFNAGFLCALLDGKSGTDLLRWGNASGAIVAGGSGTSAERLSRSTLAELAG